MCFGCALVAGVVIATSQIIPVQSQTAVLSNSVATFNSKTLGAFPASSVSLSSAQRKVIQDFLFENALGESVLCSVTSSSRDSLATKNKYRARAKAACDYVKKLNPDFKTLLALRPVSAKGAAGVVTLQVKTLNPVLVETPVAQPPIAKSPFETPFPTVFTKDQLSAAALANTKAYFSLNSKAKEFTLSFEETIPENERAWMMRQVSTAMAVLPFRADYKPLIVVGSTDRFINAELARNGVQGQTPQWWCGSETISERGCAGLGWTGWNLKYSIENKYPIRDAGRRATLAHELYHIWHKSVDGSTSNNNTDPRSPMGVPRWFMEGSANFFGFAIADFGGATTYQEGRVSQIESYLRSSTIPLRDHVSHDPNPYGIGQAATEYLVASVGVEKFLSIYQGIGQGKTFAKAFEDGSGMALDAFFERFELVRKNLY